MHMSLSLEHWKFPQFLPEVALFLILLMADYKKLVAAIEDIAIENNNAVLDDISNINVREIRSDICPDNGRLLDILSCHPCNRLEMELKPECKRTGYMKVQKCEGTNNEVVSSCSNAVTMFWTFELCMLLVGMGFGFIVLVRRRQLDRIAIEKIRKQIDSSL